MGRRGVEPFHVVARAPLHEGGGVVGIEHVLELRQAGADERNRPFLPAAHVLHDRAERPDIFQVGAQEFVEGVSLSVIAIFSVFACFSVLVLFRLWVADRWVGDRP